MKFFLKKHLIISIKCSIIKQKWGRSTRKWKKVEEKQKGVLRMLIGEYNHSIDVKGRIIMPAKFRDDIGDVYYITISQEKGQCLKVYSPEEWKFFFEKVSSIKESDKIAVRFKREVLSHSAECNVDKQGRILIPDMLIKYAGIERDVAVVGQGSYIELWAHNKWVEYNEEDAQVDQEKFAEQLSSYGL